MIYPADPNSEARDCSFDFAFDEIEIAVARDGHPYETIEVGPDCQTRYFNQGEE